MRTPLLALHGVTIGFGGHPLFRNIDLDIAPGDRVCLVGRNGCGKSTLLRIAAGELEPDDGERTVRSGITVAYVPQEPVIEGYATLTEYVASGLPPAHQHEDYRVATILSEIGLIGDRPASNLSGGEMRRAVLARTLVAEPDILLLDEPTNHLDLPAIEWLERRLASFRGGFVLISHDRRFLETLTRSTLWLDRGVMRRTSKSGFKGFEAWSEQLLEEETKTRAKMDKVIAEETRWSREGISARRKRNQGRLRRLYSMRAERGEQVARSGDVQLQVERGSISGKLVIQAKNIHKAYGGRVIIDDFTTTVLRGDRVGLVGPNGAGKTTLVQILTGELAPDRGTVKLGTKLSPVYLDQRRAKLDPNKSVWDTLVEQGTDQILVHGEPRHVMGYLKDYLFSPQQARTPVGGLSGGERNRLLLAQAMARPSNLLILDEPTNDLDIETLDVLQEALANYAGTLLLVSHDRDFLDRVVTSTILFEGDGTAIEYAGGYTDAMSQRRNGRSPTMVEASKPMAKGRAPQTQTKLSYKQTKALETLAAQIAALGAEIKQLEGLLEDPDAYSQDPDRFNAAIARAGAAGGELEDAEEAWLELEVLRESFENG